MRLLSCVARLMILGLAIAGAAPAVEAQWAVEFADGRILEVDAVAHDGEQVRLSLPGGGEIAVPVERLVSWEDVTPAPPPEPPTEPPSVDDPWRDAAGAYAEVIGEAAARHGLDPALLTAVAQVESAFNPSAVSPKGACGLLQLMPATAERFGVDDPFDPGQNVNAGARYLSWLLERFDGREDLALAGYNAGEGAVDRHKGIPPYRETRRYVSLVLQGAGRLAP